jgi:NADP-dependent 3-hydroxy acid dehydrogenase YdfG
MVDQICFLTGVGAGTGAALARRFAEGGYKIAMVSRNKDNLAAYEKEIPGSKAYPCDVSDLEALEATVKAVQSEMGKPRVLIHNAVSAYLKKFRDIDPKILEHNFRVNTTAYLRLAQLLTPDMIEAGDGVILTTGNTAARRGVPGFADFAPTKAAQRILGESMARDIGPDGVHVCYIMIDAIIDMPWARKTFPGRPDDFFCKPSAIADTAYHVAHQDKSAWSSIVEIRPFGETW